MSLRVLGRQWKSGWANRNKTYWPGTPDHPQGQLFIGGGGQLPLHSADMKEAVRRQTSGENNPGHSWDPPFLKYHFVKGPQVLQGKLFE